MCTCFKSIDTIINALTGMARSFSCIRKRIDLGVERSVFFPVRIQLMVVTKIMFSWKMSALQLMGLCQQPETASISLDMGKRQTGTLNFTWR